MIERAIDSLGDYASYVLVPVCVDLVAMRLARRKAYDALNTISDALQRSSVEPRGVQIPLEEVALMLDHGQRVMAHLSMVRVMVASNGLNSQLAEVVDQLSDAKAALKIALFRSGSAGLALADKEGIDHISPVPDKVPGKDALPWLLRRLRILVREAQLVRIVACSAIVRLEADHRVRSGLQAHP